MMMKKKSKKSAIRKLPVSVIYSSSSGRCSMDIHLSESEEEQPETGLEINEKTQLQFCYKIRKFSHNFANLSSARLLCTALCCHRFSKTKYERAILACKETAENGE